MEAVVTLKGTLYNGTVVPALCLDLDGTVRYSKSGEFISGPDDVALYPGVEEKIWEYRKQDFFILGLSNQGGVAYGYKTTLQVEAELDAMLALFKESPFHIIKQCFHMEGGTVFPFNHRSLLRKPDTGMLAICEMAAFQHGYVIDWNNSLFVGDRQEDADCARYAGIPFQWAKDFFGRE